MTDKPSSVPSGLNQVEIPMTKKRAKMLAWTSFVLGALAIVSNSLTAAGFLPKLAMQICGWFAVLCTGLSWYLARRSPDFGFAKQAHPGADKKEEK